MPRTPIGPRRRNTSEPVRVREGNDCIHPLNSDACRDYHNLSSAYLERIASNYYDENGQARQPIPPSITDRQRDVEDPNLLPREFARRIDSGYYDENGMRRQPEAPVDPNRLIPTMDNSRSTQPGAQRVGFATFDPQNPPISSDAYRDYTGTGEHPIGWREYDMRIAMGYYDANGMRRQDVPSQDRLSIPNWQNQYEPIYLTQEPGLAMPDAQDDAFSLSADLQAQMVRDMTNAIFNRNPMLDALRTPRTPTPAPLVIPPPHDEGRVDFLRLNSSQRTICRRVSDAISNGFTWNSSLEGGDFWTQVRQRLLELYYEDYNRTNSLPIEIRIDNTRRLIVSSVLDVEYAYRNLPNCFAYSDTREGQAFWDYVEARLGQILASQPPRPRTPVVEARERHQQDPPKPTKVLGVKPKWYTEARKPG